MTAAALYDYPLPRSLIAQEPAPKRDRSRALYLTRGHDAIEEGAFAELPGRLRGDECLVVNDTRVIPARVRSRRRSGGAVEVFLLRPESAAVWRAWLHPHERLRAREELAVGGDSIRVIERAGSFWLVELSDATLIERAGEVPLPPYIDRAPADERLRTLDRDRYQTVYARRPGAVAAPTAGLHFTEEIFAALASRGIPVVPVTLHVGPGTFRPLASEQVEEHRVEPELFEVCASSRSALARAERERRRLVCVGTTSLRLLETLDALAEGPDLAGETSVTILPGYRFRHADGLITNFHLPRSSLLVLVSEFHGRERVLAAYRAAIERGFRFYSYSDAMVILPEARAR